MHEKIKKNEEKKIFFDPWSSSRSKSISILSTPLDNRLSFQTFFNYESSCTAVQCSLHNDTIQYQISFTKKKSWQSFFPRITRQMIRETWTWYQEHFRWNLLTLWIECMISIVFEIVPCVSNTQRVRWYFIHSNVSDSVLVLMWIFRWISSLHFYLSRSKTPFPYIYCASHENVYYAGWFFS